MKTTLILALTLSTSALFGATETVSCASHSVTIDLDRKGQVTGLVTAGGVAFGADIDSRGKRVFENTTGLFELELRKVDDYTCLEKVNPSRAKSFACEKLADGLRLVYSDFADAPVRSVRCTVHKDGAKLRWRIAAEPAPGWAVTLAACPLIALKPQIGADGTDDTLVSGHSFREGLERNPGARTWKRFGRQPGSLGVQLAVYCDPKALFLYCAEDGAGEMKSLKIQSVPGAGMLFRFAHETWAPAAAEQPYDVVTVCKDAGPGDEPLSWHDGADIYKAWAVKQRWCRTPWKLRADIPVWLKDSPVHANLYDWRGWCRRPHALEDWAEKYWEKNFPNSTVNLHFDGWERDGVYVMTDYFPLHPDNETFAGYAKALANHRVYLFPWPSGYLRAAAFDKRPDGTFAVDEREAFARTFAPHACKMPDGALHDAHYKWLKGGAVSSMCGGDPWTIDWFAKEICGKISDLGVPTLSCDQNVGGGFPACWDRTHPHPPGLGRWITDSARRQAAVSLDELRRRFPEAAAFCFEEANEHLNDVVSYSYSREPYDPDREWANVFTYLYHEYVPIYPTLGGVCRFSDAYALTAGLMPRLKPRFSDFDPSAKPKPKAKNGRKSSEDPTALWNELVADLDDEARTRFVRRWVSLYSGEGREWLMFGRRVKPPRIDCASVSFGGTNRLAVFVGAYEALDGRRALVFANGTDAAQRVTWRRGGRAHELTLAPYEVQLLPEDDLLKRWADGLIALQVGEFARPELKGGVLCPACGFLHGRIGDVAYPFAHLYAKTGDAKYLKGAEAAVDWCERNMLLPTGLYRNDRQSYWRSTTAFCAIPLWKALRDYGEKLPAATAAKWRRILHRQLAALYELYEHDPDFKAVINYYAVYPEAMYIAWKELGDEKYLAAAKRQAKELLEQAFNKDGFLIGEGKLNGSMFGTSPRGCNLVDFGYNLEESLTAIVEYANMTGDAALRAKAVDSAKRQLEFVLPDGAIDNSCGSRSVKWTYYGSRTSDGILSLLALLKDDVPYAARMAERVIDLYTRCTGPDGLIRGGYMHDDAEEPACVHHAFARAKTLVEYERSGLASASASGTEMPRERTYGAKHFPTIDTHLVSIGPWRATVSANDAFNLAARRSAAVSGGTMSMLWRADVGPVFVGTLGEYFYAEAHNMQDDRHDMKMHCLAPRILRDKHSNIFDYESETKGEMRGEAFVYSAKGRLTAPTGGKSAAYELGYCLEAKGLTIEASCADRAARYVIPLVAGANDRVTVEGAVATVERRGRKLTLTATAPLALDPCDRGGRIWSPASGMLCAPLSVSLEKPVKLTLTVE